MARYGIRDQFSYQGARDAGIAIGKMEDIRFVSAGWLVFKLLDTEMRGSRVTKAIGLQGGQGIPANAPESFARVSQKNRNLFCCPCVSDQKISVARSSQQSNLFIPTLAREIIVCTCH